MLEKVRIGKHTQYMYAKAGNIYIDSELSNEAKMQEVNEFLQDSITNLIKEGYEILKDNSKSPYAYKQELLGENLITRALVKAVKNGFVMKSPSSVKWDEATNGNGIKLNQLWADYRCRYEKHNYYIEVNKKSISYKSRRITDCVKDEWQAACHKLDKMKRQLDENELKEAVGITIEVLNVYVSAAEEGNLKYDLDSLISLKREASRQLSKSYEVNWSCLWTLDREIIRCEEYIHGFETYPAVLFLVRVN